MIVDESMQWIRNYYQVPATIGTKIKFAGASATIIGCNGQYLRARMHEACRWAEAGQVVTLHPTWEIEYVGGAA